MVTHYTCKTPACSQRDVLMTYAQVMFRGSLDCPRCGLPMKPAKSVNTSHKGPSGKRSPRHKNSLKRITKRAHK